MRHLLLTLMLLLAVPFASPAFAQKPGKGPAAAAKAEDRSQHMAAILALNDANTKRFVDLYAKYTAEIRAAQQKYRKIKPTKGGAPLTDQQVKTNTENQFALSQTILDIRKKYYHEYVKFLTARQIDRLYELEKKGAEHLREMARKRKGGGGGGKGRPAGKPQGKGKGKPAGKPQGKGKGKR